MDTDTGFQSAQAMQARFGDDAQALQDHVLTPMMATTLARRTVRRYTDQMPTEALLQALTAVAL